MDSESPLLIGFGEVEFTPQPGLELQGQMYQRIATGARDPLVACAVALHQEEETAVLVTADVCMLPTAFVKQVQQAWQDRTALSARSLLIHATHTHDAPAAWNGLNTAVDHDFLDALKTAILESAYTALTHLEKCDLFAGNGHLEQMGWNRRAMMSDGSSKMYGHSEMPGFVGLEGPRDPVLPVLFARNRDGDITGIVTGFATHPNAIESAEVYSADIPGAVRRELKKLFGEHVGVLYLTAAAGNTSPSILNPLDTSQPWRGEAGLKRSGLYVCGEVAKVIACSMVPMVAPKLRLLRSTLEIPLRDWPQPGEPSSPPLDNPYYAQSKDQWVEHLHHSSPQETRINLLRIGDVVVCTNPAELFVEFSLEIRASSPAKVTFMSELTDGYVGYAPTPLAFSRGGYETWCAPTSQLDASAGDQIMQETTRLLQIAFE